MHRILADTCVWLDMAKDPGQATLLTVIEELVKMKELELLVPKTVIDEFARNKEKIIRENSQSLSSIFKLVKEAVDKFGNPSKRKAAISLLNDVDSRIPTLGEAVSESITRIDKLLKESKIIDATAEIKLRAAQRAIDKKAPFHHQKNSMSDAVIIETYAESIKSKDAIGIRFSFVTHNKNDFSLPGGNARLPHPDFTAYFSKIKSQYYIKLSEAVRKVRPDLVTELMMKNEFLEEPRSLSEILRIENELTEKIWYNKHLNWLYRIETGEHRIVNRSSTGNYKRNETPKDIYNGARKAAKRVEQKYGLENLGPLNDFEWGMLNGKLSALRWVMGDEWDSLDT
jgi:hypothetical protein